MTGTRDLEVLRPPHLQGLDRYEPGTSVEDVRRKTGLERIVKLASNENPLGPSPKALAVLAAASREVHRYPDGPARTLRGALALRLGVSAEQVVVGNGSTDLIDLLARSFLGPENDAVISEEAFPRFRQVVRARNGRARLVPAKDHAHDLAAMSAAVGDATRLVFVADPNNPTGTWNTRAQVDALVDALPPGVLLVLDQAYHEYAAGEAGYPNGLDYVKAGAPVIVLRTFSKVYGLAGLRVGYGIGPAAVVDAVDTIREPFNSNALGQAAALAALDDQEHVQRSVASNRVERSRLAAALSERGIETLPSLGNFVCARTGDGIGTYRRLVERGVIVRPLGGPGLADWIRVSVGTREDNDTFLAALDAERAVR